MRLRHAQAWVLALAAGSLLTGSPVPGLGASAAAATITRLGSVPVVPCRLAPEALCGDVRVPLDRTDPGSPLITVGFMWWPATGPVDVGTIVPVEGGPGYPSSWSRDEFLPLFGPLRTNHDVLIVDGRGTGRSTPVDCPELQSWAGRTTSSAFDATVGQCGDRLNHTWRSADGSWVHASDLFTSAQTARDLDQVLGTLAVGPVDLYGDSYGSWFAQVFASRYPTRVRTVVLDSTYEIRALDPWYRSTLTTAKASFDLACSRSLACAAAAPGSAWARLGPVVARLRQAPVQGWTIDLNGNRVVATVDVTTLVDLVNDAGGDPDVYRQLDAAGRSLLGGDPAPLLRLAQQTIDFDNGLPTSRLQYSTGLYFAVACSDYNQLFSMAAAPADRRTELARSIAALPADTFAPFTTAEWLTMNAYTEVYTGCLDWPEPVPAHRDPPLPDGVGVISGGQPVLVVAAEFDSWTPASDGARVAASIGPSARLVGVPNAVHTPALLDPYDCASQIVRSFVSSGGRLRPVDLACTQRLPEIRSVGSFPVVAGPGTDAELAQTVVDTAGDALDRSVRLYGTRDTGLHGGTSHVLALDGFAVNLRLDGLRLAADVAVSGRARRAADGAVVADLDVTTDAGRAAHLHVTWSATTPHALAQVTGRIDGRLVSAQVIAA